MNHNIILTIGPLEHQIILGPTIFGEPSPLFNHVTTIITAQSARLTLIQDGYMPMGGPNNGT